jgi:hypothetical protein
MRSPLAILVFAGALLTGLSASPRAHAEDEAKAVERDIRELEKSPEARETVQKAKEALDRALRLRSMGDDANARLALGLARDWLDAGRDLKQTLEAEKRVAETRAKARQSEQDLAKARVELEEGVAKAGRLRSQVETKEKERLAPKGPDPKPDAAPKGNPKAPSPSEPRKDKKEKAGK